MTVRINSRWGLAAIPCGLAYPFLVYFGLAAVPPTVMVMVALGLLALRMVGWRRLASPGPWAGIAAPTILIPAVCLVLSPELAVKAYPVAISLATALLFLASLRFPPSIVERIARISRPDLPPEAVAYTRTVTAVWAAFLIGNALVSTATALWGSLELWTLWNGLLSYLAMGVLFLGEWVVRRQVRRRNATS
jgi:uncharacterized membrane protein